MKVKIELEAKEFFAIKESLSKVERRRLFGTINLRSKIGDQLEEKVSSDDLAIIEHEWAKCGKIVEANTQKIIEENKKIPKKLLNKKIDQSKNVIYNSDTKVVRTWRANDK